MKTFLCGCLCGVLLLIFRPVHADTAADLTEDTIAAGVPGTEEAAPSRIHGLVGAGLFNFKKTVGDSDRKTVPLPLIIMTFKHEAYWSLGGGGLWLLQSEDLSARLGFGIKAHPGWKPEDDPLLAAMAERSTSLDGYVNALWRTSLVNITAAFYHDIGKVSKGSSATARMSHNFWVTPTLRLTPSLGVEWQNARLVDYYYGVRDSETGTDRPAYAGRDTVNVSAGLGSIYRLNRDWWLLGGLYVVRFGDGIGDSPIVKHDGSALVYLGAGWSF